eukprot:13906870-Alexandrium_andersonii.AAC.1
MVAKHRHGGVAATMTSRTEVASGGGPRGARMLSEAELQRRTRPHPNLHARAALASRSAAKHIPGTPASARNHACAHPSQSPARKH